MKSDDPLANARELGDNDIKLVRQAFDSVIKGQLEEVNTNLIRLRLQAEPGQGKDPGTRGPQAGLAQTSLGAFQPT